MDSLPDIDSDINDEPEYSDLSKTTKVQEENGEKVSLEVPTFGFTERSWRTDFILIVEDTRLYVNKAILSLASPVFDTMFQSGFKESSSNEMELPGKKLRDVADFLRYIYPGSMIQISPESAYNILPLAEEYQVLQLKQNCENALLEQVCHETTVEELFRTLHVACLYNLVNLRHKCVKLSCEKSEEDLDDAFENSPPPAEAAKEIFAQLNKKLRETVIEQKLLIDDMSREAAESTRSLKSKNIEQERQLIILKQYLSADVKINKEISLGSENFWKDDTAIFDIDMKEKEINIERKINIWDVPLAVCISEKSYENNIWLFIEIRSKGKNMDITSKLKGRVITVNRQPCGVNEMVLFDSSFVPMSKWYNRIDKRLIQVSKVKDTKYGFLFDGHIGIIVQVYMSEPNRG